MSRWTNPPSLQDSNLDTDRKNCAVQGHLTVPGLYHCVNRSRSQADSLCCSTRIELWTNEFMDISSAKLRFPAKKFDFITNEWKDDKSIKALERIFQSSLTSIRKYILDTSSTSAHIWSRFVSRFDTSLLLGRETVHINLSKTPPSTLFLSLASVEEKASRNKDTTTHGCPGLKQ